MSLKSTWFWGRPSSNKPMKTRFPVLFCFISLALQIPSFVRERIHSLESWSLFVDRVPLPCPEAWNTGFEKMIVQLQTTDKSPTRISSGAVYKLELRTRTFEYLNMFWFLAFSCFPSYIYDDRKASSLCEEVFLNSANNHNRRSLSISGWKHECVFGIVSWHQKLLK